MSSDQPAVRFVSSLSEFERRFSIPMQVIGRYLLGAIKVRWDSGEAPLGRFSAMGAHSKERPGDGLFWVPPSQPQPTGTGYVQTAQTGPRTGWAGYVSYPAYCRLAYGGRPRDFEATGAFRHSVVLRILSPVKAKIAPYGSHASADGERRSNTSVGFLASRFERLPLLHPTAAEVRTVGDILQDEVVGQALEAARVVNIGTDTSRKVRSFEKKAAKRRRALSL